MLWFERRWIDAILGSFAPEGGPGLAPRTGEVDYLGTFVGLYTSARTIARVGFRAGLWLVALAPVWLGRGARTLPALALPERQALLAELLDHRVYAVREAAFLMKLAACLALFANEQVRARSGFDRAPTASQADAIVQLSRGGR
jgi:hypothetical protein